MSILSQRVIIVGCLQLIISQGKESSKESHGDLEISFLEANRQNINI